MAIYSVAISARAGLSGGSPGDPPAPRRPAYAAAEESCIYIYIYI